MSEWRDSVRAWAMGETPRPGSRSPINIAYFRGIDIVKQAVLRLTNDRRRSLATFEKRLERFRTDYSPRGTLMERLGLRDGVADAAAAALARCGKPVARKMRKPISSATHVKQKGSNLHSAELRTSVLRLRRRGFLIKEIAPKVGVAESSVYRIVKALRAEGWLE